MHSTPPSYIKENIVKNVIILILAAISYPFIYQSLKIMKVEQMNDFLLIISMLLVTACFACFAFTYEKAQLQTISGKILAHSATGVIILLIALLLESVVLATRIVYSSLHSLVLFFVVLSYIGVVLYDFWDLMRAN